jgi:predicted anti-sigma-YlaC factor YlaD
VGRKEKDAAVLTPVPSSDCDRARQAASAFLDGELSELEAAQLAAHRRVCADCEVFAFELGMTTTLLRRAPAEEPSRPLVLTRLRRPARLLPVRAAAGLAAAAAVLSFVAGQAIRPSGHASAEVATTIQPPARGPQPFSAFFSLTSAAPPMTRTGENVAV